jgi:hypothetical protein
MLIHVYDINLLKITSKIKYVYRMIFKIVAGKIKVNSFVIVSYSSPIMDVGRGRGGGLIFEKYINIVYSCYS